MLALLTIVNFLAFAGYCYVAWFLTSPQFIEAFYKNIMRGNNVKKRD